MEKMDEPEKGIPALIGVVLMIAITIIIASLVYVYVSGFSVTEPYLELSVIPNGYPELYKEWDIRHPSNSELTKSHYFV